MSTFKAIRQLLGATQQDLAVALGCTQGNVSLYDRGQTVLPDVGKRLIDIAKERGISLSMDQIYGLSPLPALDVEAATSGEPSKEPI